MVGYIYLNLGGTFQKPIQIIEDESQRMEAEVKRQLVFLHWLQTKKKKFWSKYWISSLMGTAVQEMVFNFSKDQNRPNLPLSSLRVGLCKLGFGIKVLTRFL